MEDPISRWVLRSSLCLAISDLLQWDFTQVEGGWQIRNAQQGTYLSYEGNPQDGQRIVCRPEPYVWNIWHDQKDNNAYRSVGRIGVRHVLLTLVPGSVLRTPNRILTFLIMETRRMGPLSSCGPAGRVTIRLGMLNEVSQLFQPP